MTQSKNRSQAQKLRETGGVSLFYPNFITNSGEGNTCRIEHRENLLQTPPTTTPIHSPCFLEEETENDKEDHGENQPQETGNANG